MPDQARERSRPSSLRSSPQFRSWTDAPNDVPLKRPVCCIFREPPPIRVAFKWSHSTQAELRLLSKLSRVLRHARPPSHTLSPLRAAHEAGPCHSSPGTSMADLAGLLLQAVATAETVQDEHSLEH